MRLEPEDARRLRPLFASTEHDDLMPRALAGAMLSLTGLDIVPEEVQSIVALTDPTSSTWTALWVTDVAVIYGRASSTEEGWGWSSGAYDPDQLEVWRRRIIDVSYVDVVETHGVPDPHVEPTWYWRSVVDVHFTNAPSALRLPFEGSMQRGSAGATDAAVSHILARIAPR